MPDRIRRIKVFSTLLVFIFLCCDAFAGIALEPVADDRLAATVRYDQTTYNIGEPIIVTLTVTNISSETLDYSSGGDYRSGRSDRINLAVVDENGRRVRDPLKIMASYSMGGGLGNTGQLGPGGSYTYSFILNLYAEPGQKGMYKVTGTYRYREYSSEFAQILVTLPETSFRVHDRSSKMSEPQMRKLLDEHGFEGVHACIIHGLQNETVRIQQLFGMVEAYVEPDESISKMKLYERERNAKTNAVKAILLMRDKDAVYQFLEDKIKQRWAGQEVDTVPREDLWMLYPMAASAEIVPRLERGMDSEEPPLRTMAFHTALRMGSEKAWERLPGVLLSDAPSRRDARDNAFLYLLYANQKPDSTLYMPDLDASMAAAHEQILLDVFRQDNRAESEIANPDHGENWLFFYLMGFHYNGSRVWEAIEIAIKSTSPVKHQAALVFFTQFTGEYRPKLSEEKIKQYLPFVRKQAAEHPNARGRELAQKCLEMWGQE